MTSSWTLVRSFRTAQFLVIVDATWDEAADLSWDEDGAACRAVDAGDLVPYLFRVRVVHDTLGELDAQYLGGSLHADPADFEDHRRCAAENRRLRASGSDAVCGSYFADLVREACRAARAKVRALRVPYLREVAA